MTWTTFIPWASLAGGLMIGSAAALYALGNGRVAGIAGVVGTAMQGALHRVPLRRESVRWAFIAGLLLAPALWRLFAPLPVAQVDVGAGAVIAAGLLVGFGVRLGSGCTSGHGVCGLSRGSLRSLANVLAFMGAGGFAVYLMRHAFA